MQNEWTSPDGRIRLINADCLDVRSSLPAVDAVIADPPYGIGEDGGRFRDRKGGGHRVLPKMHWDNERPPKAAFDWMREVSDEQIIWGGNYFADMLPVSRGWLYWDKRMGGDFSDGELAWTSKDIALKSFSFCNKHGGKVHPTQKPVALIEWCLSFVPTAETILDPFAGSCTTAIACIRTNRRCIAIEKERKYWEIGVQRCKAEYARTVLFNEAEAVA
jgi:DNA modification methylase